MGKYLRHLKTGRIDPFKRKTTVKVEYFEGAGLANIFVDYKKYTQIPTQTGGKFTITGEVEVQVKESQQINLRQYLIKLKNLQAGITLSKHKLMTV
jgi:hypothetical protein